MRLIEKFRVNWFAFFTKYILCDVQRTLIVLLQDLHIATMSLKILRNSFILHTLVRFIITNTPVKVVKGSFHNESNYLFIQMKNLRTSSFKSLTY